MKISRTLLLLLTSMLFIYNSQAAVAIQNSDQKSIFEYSAKEMEQTFQVDWGWKEKLGWWLVRKQWNRSQKEIGELTNYVSLAVNDTTKCHKIRLTTGLELFVRNLKISNQKIKYKSCSEQPTEFAVQLKFIDKIWDPNGNLIYGKEAEENKLKSNALSTISLVSILISIVGLFSGGVFFLLLALIGALCGLLGLIQVSRHPEKYRNKGVTVFAFGLTAVILTGTIVFLFFLA